MRFEPINAVLDNTLNTCLSHGHTRARVQRCRPHFLKPKAGRVCSICSRTSLLSVSSSSSSIYFG